MIYLCYYIDISRSKRNGSPEQRGVHLTTLSIIFQAHSVGDRRTVHEQGALLERYWRGKWKYWDKNLPHSNFIHHQTYVERSGIEPCSSRRDVAE
jgi:hypothetical protein